MSGQKISSPIKVGVFGAGMMGRNHLKTFLSMKNVCLVGVYDIDKDATKKAAEMFDCKAFDAPEALMAEIDCASVVTSSTTHAKVALPLLEKGIHCLVEKPFAATEEECISLINAAKKTDATLMVGHVEHFNPAVIKLGEITEKGLNIKSIETRRMSSASGRITDVDVAMDLMIHDIEVILSLVKSPVTDVSAVAVGKNGKLGNDFITAILSFENGATATATASRITTSRIRTLNLTAEEAYFELDFINQKLVSNHQGRSPLANGSNIPDWASFNVEVASERLFIPTTQPLQTELEHFIDAVVNRKTPAVRGEDALAALQVIWKIQKKLGFA